MKTTKELIILLLITSFIPFALYSQQEREPRPDKATWWIDNNGYWKEMAEKGLSKLNPMVDVPAAKYTGSEIKAISTITLDSPDVPVTTENSTQSENSIFVNPADNQNVLNSNNSTANPYPPLYGANDLYSFDGGLTWMGEIQGAGVSNSGDPAVVIGNNGWWYVNHIISGATYGQQLAYSTDQGASWNMVTIDDGASSWVLDKNHFWIDNNLASPYESYMYCAWTDFSGPHNNDIGFSYSTDEGLTWSTTINISDDVNAGSHCQGVNINTGPNGEVYAVYAIYDAKADENAYGLSRSYDGGETWEAYRIIENVRGIRASETSKDMRVNSFPVLAVDNSDGPYNGNLYMVWTNIGEPGINTGSDIDVYLIRSEDDGDTWSDPIRVNQDDSGQGNEHYFPWITCDPSTGDLSVVFYDDRNVGGVQCEVFCANSLDAGETWEDFKVSDVAFTPAPIPGLAGGYMGDYLGITARDSYVYPCWTDNRTGTCMTYVSPFTLNTLSRPYELSLELDEETGMVDLEWHYQEAPNFTNFIVYRDGEVIAEPTDTIYTDQLPDYGIYTYNVTAMYDPDGESPPAAGNIQWGNPHILVSPDEMEQTLAPDSTATQYLNITNIGELELHYNISTFILNKGSKAYCDASGGCDEYIGQVEFGEINNTSGCDEYADYTAMSTDLSIGETFPITVTNGNAWDGDEVGIWIDWNQNEDFSDDGLIIMNGGPEVFNANIIVPDDAIGGTTRMRIRMQYYGTPEPCGATSYGEVEDYTVNVISWLTINQNSGMIDPGNTDQVEVTFDATDMALGTYEAEFSITSDDPDLPEVTVPVTMIISEFGVTASADPQDICLGETIQLDCEVYGGGGSYAYAWTSDPTGFTSTLKDPEVVPTENTTYFVEASDGANTATGSVTVTVHEQPTVEIGPDTSICNGQTFVFDAGPGFTTYEWQDGSTSQTFNAIASGYYVIIVSNEFGCTDTDSAYLTVFDVPEQPAKPAGPAQVDLYEGNATEYLSTELPLASYEWLLDPSNAGSIQNNGHIAGLEWNEDFTGSVTLKVKASNDCGESEWSEELEISVINTTGIGDLEQNLGIEIYPNPNKGTFTLEMNVEEETYVNIYIFSSNNAIVYELNNINLSGNWSKRIDMSKQAAGMYNLRIENKGGAVSKQIIIGE